MNGDVNMWQLVYIRIKKKYSDRIKLQRVRDLYVALPPKRTAILSGNYKVCTITDLLQTPPKIIFCKAHSISIFVQKYILRFSFHARLRYADKSIRTIVLS
jgi:hypothetical protein